MFSAAKKVYLGTRKRHDQLWNTYVMRPLASLVVALLAPTPFHPNQITLLSLFLFVLAAGVLLLVPGQRGAWIAIFIVETSYLFDCVDGMLARHKNLASKQGHLFDFFVDEIKATMLAGALGIYLYQSGGIGLNGAHWAPFDQRFLMAGIAAVAIVASGISLTNFVRRPEISGRETSVAAFYEVVPAAQARSIGAWIALQIFTFLRFLNHYPSHIWIFALLGRLDIFFWMYSILNLLYLGRGWLGLILRFGRFEAPKSPSSDSSPSSEASPDGKA